MVVAPCLRAGSCSYTVLFSSVADWLCLDWAHIGFLNTSVLGHALREHESNLFCAAPTTLGAF